MGPIWSYVDEMVQAVKALQKKAGIAVDGIYGPATEKALAAIEAKKKKPSSNGKKSSYPLPSGIYKVKKPIDGRDRRPIDSRGSSCPLFLSGEGREK